MEREYAEYLNSGLQQANKFAAPDVAPITEEANQALSATSGVHAQLDDLESRLFGPEPREVNAAGANAPMPGRPAMAHAVRATRQSLDHINDRLSRILNRL